MSLFRSLLTRLAFPFFTLLLAASVLFCLYNDLPYWEAAPVPFHYFLALQSTLMFTLVMALRYAKNPRTQAIWAALLFTGIVASTVTGLRWYLAMQDNFTLPL